MVERPMLLAVAVLRLVLPSLALSTLLVQGISRGLALLFRRLQASSFLETGPGYKRIPSSGEASDNRNSVCLPPDENGILPVMVPVKARRRGLIYSVLSLSALSSLLAAIVFIAHSIVSDEWQSSYNPLWRYTEFYTVGCAAALFGQSIIMTWQERKAGLGRFKIGAPAFLSVLLFAGDVALLAVVARQIQIDSRRLHIWVAKAGKDPHAIVVTRLDAWTIAQLAIHAARILLLLLAALSFIPAFQRTDFKPNEYSSIMAAQQSGSATPVNGYGTMNGNRSNGNSKPSSINGKTPPEKPTPSFWGRIRILGPHLWPRKSRTLQAVACTHAFVVTLAQS